LGVVFVQKRIWGLTASMLALTCLTVTGCGITHHPSSSGSSNTSQHTTSSGNIQNQVANIVVPHSHMQVFTNQSVQIRGVVLNQSHQGIPNIQLAVVGLPDHSSGYMVKTNAQGEFDLTAKWSKPGHYLVNVSDEKHSAHFTVVVQPNSTDSGALSSPEQTSSTTQIVHSQTNIQTQTFNNSIQATDAIQQMIPNYGHPQNPLVNLGYGIKSQFIGGAGNYVYLWNEGRWAIQGQFLSTNQNGKKIMQSIAEYLHSHMMPIPEKIGAILVSDNSNQYHPSDSTLKTTIVWQKGNKIYSFKYVGDPVSALRIVVHAY
ncbi:carboxypeptidase-like regulatory domain-containing protein, partial [Alicyclobacillus tolerans]